MAIDLAEFPEWKCPYCGKALTNDEYNRAIEEFSVKAEQRYKEQQRKDKSKFEEEINKQRQSYEAEINNLRKIHNDHIAMIREELKATYDKQFQDIKKNYEELYRQKQSDFQELIEQKIAEYEQELYEKSMEYQKLQDSQAGFEAQVFEKAKASAQNEIDERDKLIKRYKEKVEEQAKQLSKKQSELKGDVGEVNLLKKLKDAFESYGDIFTKQTRGTSGADIIHQIRINSGQLLQTKIGYDNKEAEAVSAKDIEKAKKDKESLGTDYFIIVSRNLPKRDIKNGLCGQKEGIMLAHPEIVTELAKIIRETIIRISKQSAYNQDRQAKQAKVYALISSQAFRKYIESIGEAPKKFSDLQNEERKDHEKIWKKEAAIMDELLHVHIDITTAIDTIIDGNDASENQIDEQTKHPGNIDNGDVEDGSPTR
jgi:hypothetical protein